MWCHNQLNSNQKPVDQEVGVAIAAVVPLLIISRVLTPPPITDGDTSQVN
jgi:hypothetical protein